MDPVFLFPFQPYDIQQKFMDELYKTIENKNLGIFESPTGTVSEHIITIFEYSYILLYFFLL